MGFLSGVLSNIYSHLGQHKDTINIAIDSLNKNKHAGKKGFNNAIESVVAGVGRYNEKVKRSNESLSTPIKKLHDLLKKRGKWSNEVNDMQVRNGSEEEVERTAQLVRDCVTKTIRFNTALDIDKLNEIKTAINDLNPTLCERVHKVREFVKHETDTMKCYSKLGKEREKLNEMVKLIETTFENLRRGVKQKVEREVNELVKLLREKVANILKKLKTINQKLVAYHNALRKWVDETEQLLTETLAQVTKILSEVGDDPKYPNRSALETAATLIEGNATELHSQFTKLKANYLEVYQTVKGGGSVVSGAAAQISHIFEEQRLGIQKLEFNDFNKIKGGWELNGPIKAITEKITSNVRNYVETLWNAVKEAVDKTSNFNGVDNLGVQHLNSLLSDGQHKLGDLGDFIKKAADGDDSSDLGHYLEMVLLSLHDVEGDSVLLLKALQTAFEEKAIDGVNDPKLLTLLRGTAEKAISLIETLAEPFIAKLAGIKTFDATLEAAATKARDALEIQAGIVTHRLLDLCNDIKRAGGYSRDKLSALINKHFTQSNDYTKQAQDSIKKIKHDINALLDNDLRVVIEDAEAFESYANQAEKHYVGIITKYVDGRVTESKNVITNAVRKEYVTHVKGMLQAFSDRVTEDLHDLPAEITKEADKSYKGFMKLLQAKLDSSNINRILSSDDKLVNLSTNTKTFFITLFDALKSNRDIMPETRLIDLQSKLTPLFTDLTKYNSNFVTNLEALNTLLTEMRPESYAHQNNPLLQILKRGITDLHDELNNAYISVYDGASNINWELANNPETTYCAKICLTLLQPLFDGLHELRQHCARNAAWEHKTISLTEAGQHGNTITNPLGRFLQRCGYTVCSGPNKHNGELRNTAECRGGHIHKKLDAEIPVQGTTKYKLVTEDDLKDAVLNRQPRTDDTAIAKQYGILKQLVDHLHDYYRVTHLPHFAARKYPCSVFDMLKWLCGLTSSTVYNDLTVNGFDVLFEKDEKETEEAEADFVVVEDKPASLPAYPYDITTRQLRDVLIDVCHYSQDVLTCLLGHGHSEGVYACDFNTNNDGFMYPSNMDTLLCMLREILNRVYLQLHFLYQQCQYGTSLNGWLECEYGKDVGGSSWQCNTNQCADQTCKQIADQKKNQNCKLHPKCGVKSPLQSFLEDGLQGFLPHQIRYEKGKLECNVKAHSGIQCITPMGFADISHVASLTQTGHRIADVLAGFCGNQMSPLAKMCSLLNCAILSAPKTLGEMFGFYYTLLNGWDRDDKNRKEHRENAYRNAVQDANFGDSSTALDISPLFESTAHKGTFTTHVKGDLFMLVKCDGKTAALDPVGTCGSYLQPLCGDICNMYSKEHADKYLSWIVYLTGTFYDLLSKLLEDCKSKCGSPKSRCQQQTCVKNCRAVVSSTESPSLHHDAACKSIVQCQSSLPNLFKYGFYYGSASDLSGSYNNVTKRSCKDFCKALERVLNKEENRGHVLADLVFKKLPDFLFTIRQPFIWLNVALWSLSLFYLICVMVGRLDLLHIRSHLRIPSSHRITAQSLLAAAQVGRLAKISYLQP